LEVTGAGVSTDKGYADADTGRTALCHRVTPDIRCRGEQPHHRLHATKSVTMGRRADQLVL
jgi:hypothetical protein